MRIAPIQWLLSLATVSTMVGAEPTIEPVRSADAALERGRAIIAETFGVMSGTLAKAMREGGATNAVKFCSENVAQLAGGIARTNHVSMRRVSHRARNPGNRADAAELELIERFREALKAGPVVEPVVTTNAAGRFEFHAPIVLNNPVCLKCHGDPEREIGAETLSVIRALYPEDAATGFRFGELRGLWCIEFLP